jgi:hypothetical protein
MSGHSHARLRCTSMQGGRQHVEPTRGLPGCLPRRRPFDNDATHAPNSGRQRSLPDGHVVATDQIALAQPPSDDIHAWSITGNKWLPPVTIIVGFALVRSHVGKRPGSCRSRGESSLRAPSSAAAASSVCAICSSCFTTEVCNCPKPTSVAASG